MDIPQNKPADVLEASDSQAQFLWLRKQVVSILILLIVLSGTLNVFMFRSWRWSNVDLGVIRPQAGQMIAEFQKVNAPVIDAFLKNLATYASAHEDFRPIIARYPGLFSVTVTPSAAVPPALAPTPPPANTPKPTSAPATAPKK